MEFILACINFSPSGKNCHDSFIRICFWQFLPFDSFLLLKNFTLMPCWYVVVQSLSHVWLFATPWTTAYQMSLSFTVSWSLLKLMSIDSVKPSNHLTLCRSFFFLPSIFLSIRVFSSELALCIRWPKYWSVSFSISSPSEYSGLISLRIDWFDFTAVQGTLKSLLQHHSSKASLVLNLLYGPTLTSIHDYWKNSTSDYMDLCQQNVSLLNVPTRLVVAFLPRSKRLLISWLQSSENP